MSAVNPGPQKFKYIIICWRNNLLPMTQIICFGGKIFKLQKINVLFSVQTAEISYTANITGYMVCHLWNLISHMHISWMQCSK